MMLNSCMSKSKLFGMVCTIECATKKGETSFPEPMQIFTIQLSTRNVGKSTLNPFGIPLFAIILPMKTFRSNTYSFFFCFYFTLYFNNEMFRIAYHNCTATKLHTYCNQSWCAVGERERESRDDSWYLAPFSKSSTRTNLNNEAIKWKHIFIVVAVIDCCLCSLLHAHIRAINLFSQSL